MCMHAVCVQEMLDVRLQGCVVHDQTGKTIDRQCKAYSHNVLVDPST